MAPTASVAGTARVGDLLTGTGAALDAGAHALVRDPLAQTNDHASRIAGNENQFQEQIESSMKIM